MQVKKEALPPRHHQGPAYDGTCCLSQSLGIEGECLLLLLFFTSYDARYYSSSFLAPAFGLEGGTAPSLVSTGGTIILVSLSLVPVQRTRSPSSLSQQISASLEQQLLGTIITRLYSP